MVVVDLEVFREDILLDCCTSASTLQSFSNILSFLMQKNYIEEKAPKIIKQNHTKSSPMDEKNQLRDKIQISKPINFRTLEIPCSEIAATRGKINKYLLIN